MATRPFGYREIEHIADRELQIWAPDLATLLEQAARGMYALAGARWRSEPRQTRTIEIEARDSESLLVAFLTELLYFGEHESLGFDSYHIELKGNSLRAELSGAPLASIDKEIKAVTYHKLAIHQTDRGLEVNVVFDV